MCCIVQYGVRVCYIVQYAYGDNRCPTGFTYQVSGLVLHHVWNFWAPEHVLGLFPMDIPCKELDILLAGFEINKQFPLECGLRCLQPS